MAGTEKLIDAVSLFLAVVLDSREPQTEEALFEIVKAQASLLSMTRGETFSDEEIVQSVRVLQSRFVHRMTMGALFESEEYRPWLAEKQGDIHWFYWERYRKHLAVTKGFSPNVIRTLDDTTDRILDRLEDPMKEGKWARRGMVVGHVQSGKTANYTGLICKAADAGYQVIIVLAGMLSSLRSQTQERMDSDFAGFCTRMRTFIGASKFNEEQKRRPACFTSSSTDFTVGGANKVAIGLDAINEPVLFVLKKNKSILENLHRWLSEHNRHNLRRFSMLMIDDEADHASINTNNESSDPTAINKAIRNLLSLFDRSSFVGYTATPFANIFIDPESVDEMLNGEVYGDLFPRDFILSLDPPDNYVGPHRLFTDEADIDIIRTVDDNEDFLPVRHRIDFVPKELPDSLVRAINCFVLARAIRLLRGQGGKHHSMMINVSRFKDVQNLLKGIVSDHVKMMRHALGNYSELDTVHALRNGVIKSLNQTWNEEYACAGFKWEEIQACLKKSVDPIEVISINSGSQDILDYSSQQYPNGRSVITVGGMGLSRGLTLEGLMISYFLRNSIMYDTLMQMGRWFGYRDGYSDVCRIFMTNTAAGWYAHIAESTEELRNDFRSMEKAKLTPLEFGLRVRSHPTALIVTARNKMRAGRDIPVNISLEGRLAETSLIYSDPACLAHNLDVLKGAVRTAMTHKEFEKINLGYLWRNIPSSVIQTAIMNYQNHPANMLTYPEPLVEHLNKLSIEGLGTCDILLRSVREDSNDEPENICDLEVWLPKRNVAVFDDSKIEFNKRRVASKGDEKAGIPDDEIKRIKERFDGKNMPDREYRKYRGEHKLPPLFMINFVNAIGKTEGRKAVVPCFSLSFPGDPGSSRRPEWTVQYSVNAVWWQKNYVMDQDEEDEQ